MDLVVHFGMHKTGSSSIQASLYAALQDASFYYVDLGSANASSNVMTAFKVAPEKCHANIKRGLSPRELQNLRSNVRQRLEGEFQKADRRTAILSAEAIESLSRSELQELFQFAVAAGRHPIAVGYIRSPIQYMESAFQQRVKAGVGKLDIDSLYPKYRVRLEKFDIIFGAEKVRFWRFYPSEFPERCVVKDFCERLGIPFDSKKVVRVNDGLSRNAIGLLFAYRKYGPGFGKGRVAIRENGILIKRLASLAGQKIRFHRDLVAPVIEQNRNDIEWMEARLGASLQEGCCEEHGTIRCEEDLLRFDSATLKWLARQLLQECNCEVRWEEGSDPRRVAEWMHMLRMALGRKAIEQRQSEERMLAIGTIWQRVKEAQPELSVGISTDEVTPLIASGLAALRRVVEASPPSVVSCGAGGKFRIVEGNGHTTRDKTGKRIIRFSNRLWGGA